MTETNLNENLYTSLKQIGLSDQESKLYCLSLKIGPSPITDLAKLMGISRPNAYKMIQTLERFELAKFSKKEKYARNFIVESPSIILQKLRDKKEEVNMVDSLLVLDLPNLMAMYSQGENPTKIKAIQGKEQYIKIFNQSIEEEDKEIQFFGSSEDFINFITWETENAWIKKRIKKNLQIKVLTLPGETAELLIRKDSLEKRQTKVIKSNHNFQTSFMLYANKVVIWQPKTPMAVLIEDQYITAMMKSIFSMLWDSN